MTRSDTGAAHSPTQQGKQNQPAGPPGPISAPGHARCRLFGVLFVMDIQFGGQLLTLLVGHHQGDDGQFALFGLLRQRGLELARLVLLDLDLDATHHQLEGGVRHRTVVGSPVEPQGEVVAIEHADQLEGVGSRRETRQGRACRSGRRFAMVMPIAGLSGQGAAAIKIAAVKAVSLGNSVIFAVL